MCYFHVLASISQYQIVPRSRHPASHLLTSSHPQASLLHAQASSQGSSQFASMALLPPWELSSNSPHASTIFVTPEAGSRLTRIAGLIASRDGVCGLWWQANIVEVGSRYRHVLHLLQYYDYQSFLIMFKCFVIKCVVYRLCLYIYVCIASLFLKCLTCQKQRKH